MIIDVIITISTIISSILQLFEIKDFVVIIVFIFFNDFIGMQ
jgi:hypothetical protein